MIGTARVMLLIGILSYSCQITAIVPQETDLKATYKSFRDFVDTFNKYTHISKRSMTDKEWGQWKATAQKVGITGIFLIGLLVLKKGISHALNQPAKPARQPEIEEKILPLPGLTVQQTKLRQALLGRDFKTVVALVRIGIRVPKQYLRLKGNILHEILVPDVGGAPEPDLIDVFADVIDAPINKTIVQALVKEEDGLGRTPLFAIIDQIKRFPQQVDEYLKIMDILIEKSGDKTYEKALGPVHTSIIQSPIKGTLLHAATRIQDSEVQRRTIHWLLKKGVNPDIQNSEYKWYDQQ